MGRGAGAGGGGGGGTHFTMPLGVATTPIKNNARETAEKMGRPAAGGGVVLRVTYCERTGRVPGGVQNLLKVGGVVEAFMDQNGDTEFVVDRTDGVFEDGVLELNVDKGNDEYKVRHVRVSDSVFAVFPSFKQMAPEPVKKGSYVWVRIQPRLERYNKNGQRKDGSTYAKDEIVRTKDGTPRLEWRCSAPVLLKETPNASVGIAQFNQSFGYHHARFDDKLELNYNGKAVVKYSQFPMGTALVTNRDEQGNINHVSFTAAVDINKNKILEKTDPSTQATTQASVLPMDYIRVMYDAQEDGSVKRRIVVFTAKTYCDSPWYLDPSLWQDYGDVLLDNMQGYLAAGYPDKEPTTRGAEVQRAYAAYDPQLPELDEDAAAFVARSAESSTLGVVSSIYLNPDLPATYAAAGVELSAEQLEQMPIIHTTPVFKFESPYDPDKRSAACLNQVNPDTFYLYPKKKYRYFAIFKDGSKPDDPVTAGNALVVAVRRAHLPDQPGAKRKRDAPEVEAPSKKRKKR